MINSDPAFLVKHLALLVHPGPSAVAEPVGERRIAGAVLFPDGNALFKVGDVMTDTGVRFPLPGPRS